jgi:hypothetical protein
MKGVEDTLTASLAMFYGERRISRGSDGATRAFLLAENDRFRYRLLVLLGHKNNILM